MSHDHNPAEGHTAAGVFTQGLSRIPPSLRGRVVGQVHVQKCAFCHHWPSHPSYRKGAPCPGCQGFGFVLVGFDAAGRGFVFPYKPSALVAPDELQWLKKINRNA